MDLPSAEAALADFQDCLGTVDDAELARLAGIPEADVAALREARGIRPYSTPGGRAPMPASRPATPEQVEAWRARHPVGACFRVVFDHAVIFVAASTVAEALGAALAACRSTPIGVEPVGPVV